MSELKHFATELQDEVLSAFEQLTEAETSLEKARAEMVENPVKESRFMDRESNERLKKALIAREKYYDADQHYQNVRIKADGLNNKFDRMRQELKNEIAKGKPLDPGELDQGKMLMIEKGLAGVTELRAWMDEAESQGNDTMRKIIADAAGKILWEIVNDVDRAEDRRQLTMIRNRYYDNLPISEKKIEVFDQLISVAKRGIRNAKMREYWSELTAEAIEEF